MQQHTSACGGHCGACWRVGGGWDGGLAHAADLHEPAALRVGWLGAVAFWLGVGPGVVVCLRERPRVRRSNALRA
jgi:hypothetical protein